MLGERNNNGCCWQWFDKEAAQAAAAKRVAEKKAAAAAVAAEKVGAAAEARMKGPLQPHAGRKPAPRIPKPPVPKYFTGAAKAAQQNDESKVQCHTRGCSLSAVLQVPSPPTRGPKRPTANRRQMLIVPTPVLQEKSEVSSRLLWSVELME